MAPRNESPAQRSRINTANRINKTYRGTNPRRNTQPRGLQNRGNYCYRNATLQTLVHLPRFVNWILEHRAPGKNWDCRSMKKKSETDKEANETDKQIENDKIQKKKAKKSKKKKNKSEKENGDEGGNESESKNDTDPDPGCVPCLLKLFFQRYWEHYRMQTAGGVDAVPQPFNWTDLAILPLHNLTDSWFDPPTSQQCAHEFFNRMFGHIEATYDQTTTHGQKRHEQFKSLFTLTKPQYITCGQCGERYYSKDDDEAGFVVVPLDDGTDTIPAAIARTFTSDAVANYADCSSQCHSQDMTLQKDCTIAAAPEYLGIRLTLEQAEEFSEEELARMRETKKWRAPRTWKNRADFDVPDILDITQHMSYQGEDPTPVRYRLLNIVYHVGRSIGEGHYVAGVTSAPARTRIGERTRGVQWMCNDAQIHRWSMPDNVQNKLTITPLDFTSENRVHRIKGGEPYMLWYVRDSTPMKEDDPKQGGIAERVTASPRQNRGKRVAA